VKLEKGMDPIKITTIEHYPNDGEAIKVDGYYNYIKYSNGDRIWLKHTIDDGYEVTMIYANEKVSTNFNKHPYGAPSTGNYVFEDGMGNVIVWSSDTLPESGNSKNYKLRV
jgi:hypothetical protein